MKEKVIFLDFDGVMNSTSKKNYENTIKKLLDFFDKHFRTKFQYNMFGCSTGKLWKLLCICKATHASIVLTGSIKVWFPTKDGEFSHNSTKYTTYAEKFLKFCKKHHLDFDSDSENCKTTAPPIDAMKYKHMRYREEEIQHYIDTHSEIKSYVILDDEKEHLGHFLLGTHFIYTRKNEYSCGLKWKHVIRAIKILNKGGEEYGNNRIIDGFGIGT